MKLSSPIYVLKSQAKSLKKQRSISIAEALDFVAEREGFPSWSLLSAKHSSYLPNEFNEISNFFNNGDLVLVGARPSIGKTTFAIGLFVQGIKKFQQKNFYFTLCDTHKEVIKRMESYDKDIGLYEAFFDLNNSDEISAEFIIEN